MKSLRRLWGTIIYLCLLVIIFLTLGGRAFHLTTLCIWGVSILAVLSGLVIAATLSSRIYEFLEQEVEIKTRELKESHERLLTVLNSMDAAIHVSDMETHEVLFMNTYLHNLRDGVLEKSAWEDLPIGQTGPSDFCINRRRFSLDEKQNGASAWELQNNVTARWYAVQDQAIRWVDDRIVRLVIAVDITARKRAEETLEAARAYQQSIIDGVAEPIMVIDTAHRVQLMNRAAKEFSSVDTDTSDFVMCHQIFHQRETPCDGIRHPCPLEQVRHSRQPVTVVHEHCRAKGELRFVEVVAAPFLGADGSFQGIIESIRDITERKSVHDELVKLRKAVETAGEVIFMTDREGIITYINPEFTRLYGHRAEKVVGKVTPRILKSGLMSPRDYESFWETLLNKQVVKGEIINRCKDGRLATIESSANPILDENGDIIGFLAIQRDITERKQAEATLQAYAEHLRALTRQLADVAEVERQRLARELHDRVGQNLTALGINLNIVRSKLPQEATAGVQSRLDDSLSLVEKMAERIRDVMANLRPPVLDDYGLVAALHWYAERFAQRTDIAMTVKGQEPTARLPPRVETALFRIAQEALTNVAKHARATRVTVAVELGDETLRLIVSDDGIGFDPAHLTGPNGSKGWGLLTMTERAEAVGGRFRIESRPSQGTQVIVEVDR